MPDGTIKKRKDGRYELQLPIGKSFDGKYKKKSFYGSSTREVKRKRDEWLEKQARHENVSQNISFEKWAIRWVETYKKDTISESTYRNTYLNNINNYLIPYFQNAKLTDIRKIDVQDFFNNHKNESSAVLTKLKNVLNQMFESAVDEELCFKNPCRKIKLPAYQKVNDKNVYSLEQCEKVFQFAKNHPCGIDIAIILKTGIRRGELLALEWDDIDFKNNLLSVTKAVNSSNKISNPKSKSGIRKIPFDSELHDFLIPLKSSGYVVQNAKGGFMQANNWDKRHLKIFMNDLSNVYPDIPILSAHELRHTYGTQLREKGIDIYTIQKVMGHSDIKVTADVYVHNDVNVLKEAMKI